MEENIFRIGLSTKLSQCIKELRCLDGLGNIKDVQQLEIISEKKIWTSDDKESLLHLLSQLLLLENGSYHISKFFHNITPELYLRCRVNIQKSTKKKTKQQGKNVLSLLQLSLNLFGSNALLNQQIILTVQWIPTLLKTLNEDTVTMYLKLLLAVSEKMTVTLEKICNVKDIQKYSDSLNLNIKWYALKVLAKAFHILDTESYLKEFLSNSDFNELILDENFTNDLISKSNKHQMEYVSPVVEDLLVPKENYLESVDLKGNFVPMFNMLLENKILDYTTPISSDVVLTPSTVNNLKSLVLAVSSNSPVLLSGSYGSGKTMIISYLASKLCRNTAPDILKLQLGDQTDSKSLLGTYICADKPGEFKWQPGTLTQAVQQGSWLLLEDIDAAPSDVISTLIPLIKSKRLTIPGHGEEIKVSRGCQIFATTRTDCSGLGKNQQSSLHLFSKLCHIISMKVPTKEELIQIVEKRYPKLTSLAFKMVDIYCMISPDTTLQSTDDVEVSKMPVGSRTSSPRDLFKWCSRISDLYLLSDGNITNEEIFLNAMQCFCSSIPKVSDRSLLAFSLGAKLGLSKEKVEYFLTKYKPNLSRNAEVFEVGSTKLMKKISTKVTVALGQQKFAFTRHSLRLLEDIAVSVKSNEPVLLVGETGGGKTSCIQLLAEQCGRKVNVINMSQQSDIADLLGGFKPVDIRQVVRPVKDKFVQLFIDTYSQKSNAKFLGHVNQCFNERKWSIFAKLLSHCSQKAIEKVKGENEDVESFEERQTKWKCFYMEVSDVEKKISTQDGLVFSFIEGSLVKSIQNGDWILLDEINLATAETLEYLSGLLDGQSGSMVLTERGDIKPVKRHESFRLFACMNPATDVGKKDLPYGIRNRFTEIYVDEIADSADLKTLVAYYLKNMHLPAHVIDGIVSFYLFIKEKGKDKLVDSSGSRPHYSLRTLCRGLVYAVGQSNLPPLRSLYEGLSMSFLTQLDRPSHPYVQKAITTYVFENIPNIKSVLSQQLPKPNQKNVAFVGGYWLSVGTDEPRDDETYVLTKSVKGNLKDLSRVVAGGKYPVLLQGETSVGKTSLISYLSALTGNHCVRINNHEHTDIQEYIGCYGVDDNGSLIFKEGVLVTAMRQGHWIILDELNLAPTDVLEALNRLLDDNRELFIAETQETVKAHPRFMLFATQNPPGHYGGRKMLSRAFRNRFVELHFGEIPSVELEEILHKRCHLPMSYCKKFVKAMLDLQLRRKNSGIFAGKHSFMTLRDLFRWAERYRLSENDEIFSDWEQCICEDGFMLIAGRCRREDETLLIKDTLERNFKKKIDLENLYGGSALSSSKLSDEILSCSLEEFQHIVWTRNMKRLAVLVGRALQFGEAALLVGETGCGKTTVCQLFSSLSKRKLYSVNCHMHTEAADFLGGLRPVRAKESGENQKLFEWCDGPLVDAMRDGEMFLIDEISLADDSVLERLNSVLETDRILVLSERGEVSAEKGKIDIIRAAEQFRLVATMNPGGDFGKKELSPALRNRFTEIWCSPSDSDEDLIKIIEHNITPGICLNESIDGDSGFGLAIVGFLKWFKNTQLGQRFVISIRDILSWVQFINSCCTQNQVLTDNDMDVSDTAIKTAITAEKAYIHGCCLVLVDSIGSGNTALHAGTCESVKEECLRFLKKQIGSTCDINDASRIENGNECFGIPPFTIQRGPLPFKEDKNYSLNADTTRRNALRLLRGMQLPRPILLEGSPGVGKTSLVIAIARIAGYNITRINLSEETDVSDLFGADLPIEGGQPGQFAWRDGPLLKALKAGHWVVFDEMNLASQSVLEGLNACFDHRAEIYVPELNKSFTVQKEKTKIFACQNPLKEGGGRKGLPKSFLNRFTKVYVDAMSKDDLCLILRSSYAELDAEMIEKIVKFNDTLHKEIVLANSWGRKGGPWEFNVRDLMRWCELIILHKLYTPGDFVNLIYASRMRDMEDKKKLMNTYKRIFQDEYVCERGMTRMCQFDLSSDHIKIGYSQLAREVCSFPSLKEKNYQLLRTQLPYLENIIKCVEMNWMSILVGSESSGKNAMVGILAKLCGQHLNVLSMNSGMDTTDFIGGFEQLNLSGHVKALCNQTRAAITHCYMLANTTFMKNVEHREQLVELDHILLNLVNGKIQLDEGDEGQETTLDKVESVIYQLKPFFVETICGRGAFETIERSLEEVKMKWECSKDRKGQFEWVDGILVKCLKDGHWLLIENVNFCSSSILDRLNGLLEPNGVLTIDECGVVDGEIPKVKPHPNFRLFLSMDPRFGEISRAMRNRGVEIYIPSEGDGVNLDSVDKQLLIRSIFTQQDTTVARYLQEIYEQICLVNNKVKTLSLMKTTELCSMLISNGMKQMKAIEKSCFEMYCRNEKDKEMKQAMENCINQTLSKNLNDDHVDIPSLPCVRDFNRSTTLALFQRICLPFVVSSDYFSPMHKFVVSFEKIVLKDMSFWFDYIQRIPQTSTSVHIERLRHFHETQSMENDGDLSICKSINNKSQVELSSKARKYFALLLQCLKGFNEVLDSSKNSRSIMTLSKDYTEGRVSAVTLPHQSVMYLYKLCRLVINFIGEMWNNGINDETPNHLAELEESFTWFNCFLAFCRKDLSVGTFSSQTFSVNKYSLHWKWVFERFFDFFAKMLPDVVKVIVEQVDKLLGHDSISYILQNVVTALGIPKTYLFEEQAHLLDNLSELFEKSHATGSSDDRVSDEWSADLLQCAKDILIAPSLDEEKDSKVQRLSEEITNNSPPPSGEVANDKRLVEQTLFSMSFQKLTLALHSKEMVGTEDVETLNKFGFSQKVIEMKSSVYLSLLRDYCYEKDSEAVISILPYLLSSSKNIKFEDKATLFSDDPVENQVCQHYLSPCTPLLGFINKSSRCEKSSFHLQISLKDVNATLGRMKGLQRMLWSNVPHVMNGKHEFQENLLLSSYIDVLRVVEGFGRILKNETLIKLSEITFTKLIRQDKQIRFSVFMVNFFKIAEKDSDIPKGIRNILSYMGEVARNRIHQDLVDATQDEILCSNIACLSGLLLFQVTKPSLKYDPVEELQLRLQYLQKELTDVENELQLRYHCEYIWSGVPEMDITQKDAVYKHLTSNPERIRVLLVRRQLLINGIRSIERSSAARPKQSQYNALYQDFLHFNNSIGKAPQILSQLKEINEALSDDYHNKKVLKNLVSIFKKVKTWVNSVDRFATKLTTSYPLYNDIILLPTIALKHCLTGFDLLLTQIKQRTLKLNFTLDNKSLVSKDMLPSDIFQSLIFAPLQTPENSLKILLDHKFLNATQCIAKIDSTTYGNLVPAILNLALLNVRKHMSSCLIAPNFDKNSVFTFLKEVLEQYFMLWQHKKQEDLEENVKQEAFFRFKSQVHCNELTDEEKFNERQKRLFPSFEHEFSDLVKSDTLEGTCEPDDDEEEMKTGDEDDEISMKKIDIDEDLLYKTVRDIYMKPTDERGETEETMLKRYLSQALLLLKLPQVNLGICYEDTVRSVYRTISLMIHEVTVGSPVEREKFNIYNDYDIPEAICVRNILNEFQNFIFKLLSEFEEHPALLQINQVVERILSFSVSCPVMKFLTGLEFLLKEAQNWETYAGSHVSMRKYLEEITNQVIKWRKLELMCWPQLIERCEEKISCGASKWFFHFYNLLKDVQSRYNDEEDGKTAKDDFIEALKEFFEHATVGDYKGRIELIEIFLKDMEVNNFDQGLQNIVWNVCMYYKQFLPVITQYMADQKKPIAKELKDYVKIAKWNDINFFAIRQAVAKSHRTLNKFVGKYEQVLTLPIMQFLKDPKHISNLPSMEHTKQFEIVLPAATTTTKIYDVEVAEDLYVNKIDKLQNKTKRYIDEIVTKTGYGGLIEDLDGFTGDIIDGIKELQNVDVLKLPKEKQKAARNNLQQRKRKALSSLFKELKAIGLSYRKGINFIENEERNDHELAKLDDALCMRSMDSDYNLVEILASSNEYFFKCQAKQSVFFNAMLSPSKELGPPEIHRFKGLTEHLLHLAIDQRKDISSLLQCQTKIGSVIGCAKDVIKCHQDEASVLPPQQAVKQWLFDLESLLNKGAHNLQQLKLFLESSPSDDTGDIRSPFTANSLPKLATCHANSQLLLDVKAVITKNLSGFDSMKGKLKDLNVNEKERPLINWDHWRFINECVTSLESIQSSFKDIVDVFVSPRNPEGPSLADDVIALNKDITVFTDNFRDVSINKTIQAGSDELNQEGLVTSSEDIIQQILIGIQGLVKKADLFATALRGEDQDENVLMKAGHLVPLLTTKFTSHISSLDAHALSTTVQSALSKLQLSNTLVDDVTSQKVFFNTLPMLESIYNLIGYYVFHSITLHRTSCKLLFVLYGLFTDLATQGYCIPPEESDEMAGEGATDFEDIEGGGLGEGEGAKDVSEQIETEDQVEDTKHEKSEESEKKEDDDSGDIEEEKEGIEMNDDFDSKLQDLELDADESEDDEKDEKEEQDEEEPDKQMGEVDGEQQETVDDKMWGDSDNEDDQEDEQKEEKGPGAEAKTESELVAKEDNEGEQESKEEKPKNKGEEPNEEPNESEMKDEINNMDEEDDQGDEKTQQQQQQQQQDDDSIPDDLDLDKQEEEGDEENPEEEEDGKVDKEEILNEEVDMEDENNEDGDEKQEDDEKNTAERQEETMEEDEEGEEEKKDPTVKEEHTANENQKSEDNVECAPSDQSSTTFESNMNQSENSDLKEQQGVGKTESESREGHLGASDSISKSKPTQQKSRKRKDVQHSKDGRTLEESESENAKRRKALDAEEQEEEEQPQQRPEEADTYQHIDDESAEQFDQLTIDAATQDQLKQQQNPQNIPKPDSDVEMDEDEEEADKEKASMKDLKETDPTKVQQLDMQGLYDEDTAEETKQGLMEEDGAESTTSEDRDIKSDFFTSAHLVELPLANVQERDSVMDELRKQLENELISMGVSAQEVKDEKEAMTLWLNYEKLTSGLAQQLCEQLRLVLEPTLASKMRGDYRTGKRLNMRKVIPYIASQFRKDKIWLRRTKKSKRQYQIVLAVDDSSSMADNHSKQLAFESLAVISNALQWLEAGELAVCSFGEEARLLHSFDQSFSEHAGASILQQFTFEQKSTKIAQLLNMCTVLLNDSKARQRSSSNVAISQLLLIVSDGRGIFLEGKETVVRAVRNARDAGVFIVFLIMDDPKNRDSILDIKVPIFKPGGGLPEIRSYIEDFPFPFYVLLRDINSLPFVLSDSLKQWFELVTQTT